ncbi:MAG: ADP-ribosylglycohydrolase family protein [Ktedonobacterales bacterium]
MLCTMVLAFASAASVLATSTVQVTAHTKPTAAIRLGNDTDTTACISGGLAGIRDGLAAIPARWRDGLRGQEIYGPLLERSLVLG